MVEQNMGMFAVRLPLLQRFSRRSLTLGSGTSLKVAELGLVGTLGQGMCWRVGRQYAVV